MVVVLSFCMGIGAALVRAKVNQGMYRAEDLPGLVQAPFLGQVPLLRKADALAAEQDPFVAESMRMVRTALFSRIDGRGSTVLISSADIGAGKSTVALGLARSLADSGKKVLLIDADLRRPALSAKLNLANTPGLMEVLVGQAADDRSIFETDTPRLSFMPAGTLGDGTAIEATANGAFAACLDRLRPRFDVIVLDSSPILRVADARILSRQTDGTILVVRQDSCRRSDVVDALAFLGASGGKLLGTVFIGSGGREKYRSDGYYHKVQS
jgi:receptor protein-tyrosine kinase